MKNSLRHFAVLAIVVAAPAVLAVLGPIADATPAKTPAQSARPPATGTVTPGDRLLAESLSRIERRRSITASLRHQILLNDVPLYGVGSYCQLASDDGIRVRMELRIAGQDSRLLQVSNSRFLWVDRVLPTGRAVSRIDLRQLRSDPVLAAASVADISPGEARWLPAHAGIVTPCGGLPHLLMSLCENFTFLPPQAMRLVSSPDANATGVPLFAVVGHWKPEKLAGLLEAPQSQSGKQPASAPTVPPNRLPAEVLLLVDQNHLFPYRIEYRRLETPARNAANGAPAPFQLSAHPLVVLEFFNVAFDVEVEAGQFDYAPPNVDWEDHTDTLVDRLRRERQAQIAARAKATLNSRPSR